MTYTINKAFGRDSNQRLVNIDDPVNQTYHALTQQYRNIQLELENNQVSGTYTVALEQLGSNIRANETLNDYLTRIGDDTIPHTQLGTLDIRTDVITHANAFSVGFHVEPALSGSHPTLRWPESAYSDLLLSIDGGTQSDYEHLHNTSIVHINGFTHRTSASPYGLYVIDGNKSFTISGETEVTITDLSNIGQVEQLSLSSTMIERVQTPTKLNDQCYLDLGQSLEGKTVLVSIGGYLHFFDDLVEVIGDTLVKIHFARYPHIQRYFESKAYLDMGSITYTPMDKNDEQRLVSDFLDNEDYIKQLLDLEQSFALIVDQAPLFVETYPLQWSHLVANYYTYERPKQPLVLQRGRFRSYRYHHVFADQNQIIGQDYYVVNLADDYLPQYHFETIPISMRHSVTPQKIPSQPWFRDRPHVLNMGIDRYE